MPYFLYHSPISSDRRKIICLEITNSIRTSAAAAPYIESIRKGGMIFMAQQSRQHIALRVSAVSIAVNCVLTVCKLLAGIAAHSGAMISDAVHSGSDVASTVVVMIGVRLGGKASDHDHPYGHERMECVAALLLAVALGLTGAVIGISGVRTMLSADGSLRVPGALALAAAVVSIAVKEAMYHYTARAARHIRSSALMADAWHHRSDALSSVGSFAGILGARLGVPLLDPLASVVICVFILKAAVDVFLDAVQRMVDHAADDETAARIRQLALEQDGVFGVDQLKTRVFGDRIYVDLEISADGRAPLTAAHAAAHRTHDAIEQQVPAVKHCMVHVNPAPPHGSE